jgi:hypothetical protein
MLTPPLERQDTDRHRALWSIRRYAAIRNNQNATTRRGVCRDVLLDRPCCVRYKKALALRDPPALTVWRENTDGMSYP